MASKVAVCFSLEGGFRTIAQCLYFGAFSRRPLPVLFGTLRALLRVFSAENKCVGRFLFNVLSPTVSQVLFCDSDLYQ